MTLLPTPPEGRPAPLASGSTPEPRPGAARLITSDFQTFLRMLTVQMQNQDPLNPMQATDFAVQLATFSGVEQQVRTNQLLESLAARLGAGGLAEVAGWVGMDARVSAPAHFGGAPVRLAPEPPPGAERVELVVRNGVGSVVDRRDLPPDVRAYDWPGLGRDGVPLPEGPYSFALVIHRGGAPVAEAPVDVYAPVLEARLAGGEVRLLLPGGIEVPVAAVRALRAPG